MRYCLDDLAGRRTLLVASTGGHLIQLKRLAARLGIAEDSPWLTFDTPQSRTLLNGREVLHVPYVKPRDLPGIIRASLRSRGALADVEGAISTGAGIALAVLPELTLRGKPAVYIESVSRVTGPSLSGRILQRLPRVGLYCQHPAWAASPWRLGPSVLADHQRYQSAPARAPRKMLVALGTIAPYRFDRLVNLVQAYQHRNPDVAVRWQLGCTDRSDLVGDVRHLLGAESFAESIGWADLVVAHAGVGVAMNILDHGKLPVLLPRRRHLGEHVDDHQEQIYRYLVDRNLALDASAGFADPTLLRTAVGTHVRESLPGAA